MTKNRYGILALTVFLSIIASISVCPAARNKDNTTPLANGIWAWDDTVGDRHAIFISRQAGAEWQAPEQISDNEGVNVVPTVIKTAGKDLFAVWTTFTGQQAQLRFRQYKKGAWSEEREYYTGLSSNTSPSVGIDGGGMIWLVWAGFNGVSDNIYYTTWNGNSFETARPLTRNDVPDIQPVLGMDEKTGHPWVQWRQFTEDGYIALEASWNGSAWSDPVQLPAMTAETEAVNPSTAPTPAEPRSLMLRKNVFPTAGTAVGRTAATHGKTKDYEIDIPEFITYPESASIHIPGYAIQSLPVRSVVTDNQ